MSDYPGVSPSQRKSAILETLRRDDEAKVPELAEAFGVTCATIRSDLAEMEQAGLLRRTHGGAVSTKKSYYNMSLNDRMNENKGEKIRIAKACASLIKDGDTLMILSGTTTRYLAKELTETGNLTVVTNAMQIAEEFVYSNSINVILLGGNLDTKYLFTFGHDTISQLQNYRADKMILAVDGISVKHGLTTYHYQEIDVTRQMMERASTIIVAADHSKIGKEGFSYVAPLANIDILVTDSYAIENPELDEIQKSGVDVKEN